jgi:hypothetical protein
LKKLLLTVLSVNIVVFASNMQMQQQNLTSEQMAIQKKTIMELASKEFSRNVPQKIDKYTTFTGVTMGESSLIWSFDINTGAKSDKAVKQEDHSRMEKAVTSGVCQKSKRFFDAGINISYAYNSEKTKEKLFQFDITHKKCLESFRVNKIYY